MFEAADDGLQGGGCDTNLLERWTKSAFSMTDVSLSQIDVSCPVASSCNTDASLVSPWDQNIAPVCRARQSSVEKYPTISPTSAHNLCAAKLKPNPTTCRHPQGMLYGLQGNAWPDLYAFSDILNNQERNFLEKVGGIFENPMAAGRSHPTARYGLIQSMEDEIAGHYMSYKITSAGRLVVDKIPLSGNKQNIMGNIFNIFETSNPEWLPNLAGSILEDVTKMEHMGYDSTKSSNAHWTCPLREVLLWSGMLMTSTTPSSQNNKLWVPNPLRTGRMYSRLLTPFSTSTSTLRAHPTTNATAMDVLNMIHTDYWTTNGFCAYTGGSSTSTNAAASSVISKGIEACALHQLARSVWDGQWRDFTTVFANACTSAQVDWPYTAFAGRDGTYSSQNAPANQDCAVLDRLSVFQYRIKTDTPIQFKPSSTSRTRTVSKKTGEGMKFRGVCHMAAAAHKPKQTTAGDCWKIGDLPHGHIMRCKTHYAGTVNITWPKKGIKTPQQMVLDGMRRRQKCNQCSTPPRFVKPDSQTAMPAPEVGYGRPFQWETARMLAGDLRFFLCGNATACPHIEADEWTLTKFLQHFFSTPENLILPKSENTRQAYQVPSLQDIVQSFEANMSAGLPADMQAYEQYLWEGNPWVVCVEQNADTLTNGTSPTATSTAVGLNCSGTISKAEWIGANRVGHCKSRVVDFLQQNPGALSMNVDLCNINAQMDGLCKKLLDNVLRITNLNCILSGKDTCLEKSFFYTPSVFSSSNQQFVRDTVRQFYQRFEENVCAADSRTQTLISQNVKLNSKCAAVPLQSLKISLEGARSVVDIVMNIIFDSLMITTDLMMLLVSTAESAQQLTQDLFYWFQKLIIDAAESLKQIGNVLYKALLENSPLGSSFRAAMQTICSVVEWIMNYIWSKFLCYIVKYTVPIITPVIIALLEFVGVIIDIINTIACAFSSCLPEEASVISKLVDVVKDIERWILENMQCGIAYNFNCYPNQTFTALTAALPVATRCWAGFQPDAGDASVLSCTRADTCWDDTKQTQVVCDACPLQAGEDFLQFACSPLTKRCSCGVQRFERTRCTTHEQCFAGVQDASCMRISNPLATNAYSTVPCKQCPSQPVCIVSSNNQPGKQKRSHNKQEVK